MVQLLCSNRVYEKLKQELSKYQIDIKQDSDLVLVESGFDLPREKLCVVFEAIDYMDVIKLLVSGARGDLHFTNTVTGLSDNKFAVIEPRDVIYIEAGSDGLLAHTKSKPYSIKETLQYYESLWAARGFIRINKSQIVNLLHVKEIVPWFNSRYVLRMDNHAELEVSKMFSKKLRNTLNI
ncbi:LytTR family DNA-binding domain-containing protein [Paenibacillus arenilitoris]|uniref:LytTR family transcriptional regulator DNA-binding domain-containing protein n=1 Tax=Paenibacillus arenilitoris TaxID=2772299 RepID=A0A927CQG3_9BACL|nr:LytTR family DNA-binding domain-containing protein [Paenibacillus arenilitoris]MBD2870381.1 LytTR family transcriptional regulator DNA-binding domain-containing protein [Paenibacillus arenilitoris]